MKKEPSQLKRLTQRAIDLYDAAAPKQRRRIAKRLARLGVQLMAHAHGIPTADRKSQTFVDRESGECMALLEYTDDTVSVTEPSQPCNDPHCPECAMGPAPTFEFPDVAALLGEIVQTAKQHHMSPLEVAENVIANLHAWRDPPAEAYN